MPSRSDRIDESLLLDFLEEIDRHLPRRITLVAVGGTAMTLLHAKTSTRDIDLTGPAEDIALFKRVLRLVPHGMKIDMWVEGQIFSQMLPSDYLEKSIEMKRFKKIRLMALSPLDIVVTKLGRLDERDQEDILACIKMFRITRRAVKERASEVTYVGNQENYEYQVRLALSRFFKSP